MATGTVITNAGLTEVAKLICGATADAFTYVALGTGGDTPAATDTTLKTEISTNGGERVVADTHAYAADYKSQWVEEFTFSGALAILECGILNAAADGDLLVHHVFPATINVVSTDTLTLTVEVTLSDETA
jgi:hypothetical protein